MSIPKRHHFLPKFYLNAFQTSVSRKISKVYVIEKNNICKSFISSVKNTGCKKDYHTIGKGDRLTVEVNLSKIESRHALMFKKIIDAASLDKVDLNELASALLFLRNRVPNVKDFVEESLRNVTQSSANFLLAQGVFPKAPDVIQEIIDSGRSPFKVKISNEMILHYMFLMAQDERAIELLSSMNFSLLKAPKNSYFITSDAPVALFVPDYEIRKPYGVGLIDKEIEVTIPISKEYLVFVSRGPRVKPGEIASSEVEEYNRRTIISAQNYIYANACDANITNLVKRHCAFSSGVEVSTMSCDGGNFHFSRFIPVLNRKNKQVF